MSTARCLIVAVAFAAVSLASPALAAPGDLTTNVDTQTCSKGCVAGLLVMAGVVAVILSSLMCFIFWPAAELDVRQERRALARKHIRERKAAEEEARAKNEALEGHEN